LLIGCLFCVCTKYIPSLLAPLLRDPSDVPLMTPEASHCKAVWTFGAFPRTKSPTQAGEELPTGSKVHLPPRGVLSQWSATRVTCVAYHHSPILYWS